MSTRPTPHKARLPSVPRPSEDGLDPLVFVTPTGGPKGEAQRELKPHLARRDNFIEQRKHRRMAPCVVDVNERRGAVTWTQGTVPKVMSSIEVMGKFVSRRNCCA